MANKSEAVSVWSAHDTALWHTCEIAVDLAAGRAPQALPEVLAPFPPPPGDRSFWASGVFELLDWRAVGDGTYMQNNGFFFASGPLGLALTAAATVGRAAGNHSRRRAAADSTVPRWVIVDSGLAYLAPSGFTMHTARAPLYWPYTALSSAQMVGPRSVHFQGQSDSGPVSWILLSDWAELLFVTWALRCHPRHPQLLTGAWLPPGWLDRCAQHAYRTRLVSPELEAWGKT